MIRLHVHDLCKTYRRAGRPAAKHVSFSLEEGHLLALVGESGSGKTTLLRLIAGLEEPDAGRIELDGAVISAPGQVVPPERRGIGLVFQHHALFPHLTVEQNVAFGLRALPAAERAAAIQAMLEVVGLPGFAQRYPHELSGGERQRVALARALAPRPRLLLLDEPFSSLDARLRQAVRDETRAILKAQGITAVFVTHDTSDALSIADHIVVLKDGAVQQAGPPWEVYHAPATAGVAAFFGACNFLPLQRLHHPEGLHWTSQIALEGGPPGECRLWVRPENLALAAASLGADGALTGTVQRVSFHGSGHEVTLRCENETTGPFEVIVRHHGPAAIEPGQVWAVIPRRT